ncbi:hypothetical protein [Micromonospora sp. NPDC048839]|uniref:hypothetical protein n=1 Tax=Micromonospora sp. NPDC048839 TaxID=3155641 RepID=UPI0033F9EB93
MKIVQRQTGLECVSFPDRGLIFVDPALNHESVVHLIQQSMPLVHPDAIRHWVEAAMPTADPLSSYRAFDQKRARSRSHEAAHRKPVRTLGDRMASAGRQFATATAAAVLGAVVAPMIMGNHGVVPASAAEAWNNPVFSSVQTGSDWDCSGTDNSDLVATCVAKDGAVMHVEAWVGPDSLTFTFAYKDPRTGHMQRNRMKVFATPEGVENWFTNVPPDSGEYNNLIKGERWIMYGTDAGRLKRWAHGLDSTVVIPADMTQAAYAMGLLVDPGENSPKNQKELATVEPILRSTVARIILGDNTLPMPVLGPVGPNDPIEPLDPSAPNVPSVPVPQEPSNPVETPPATPPTAPPINTPAEPPTTIPAEPPTIPTPPIILPVDPPPADQTPSKPPAEEAPSKPPVEEAPSGDAPWNVPADETPSRPPVDETPAGEAPSEEPADQAPIDEEPTSPPSSEEPATEPATPVDEHDPLEDPIEVPQEEVAPVHEEMTATPIFSKLRWDMRLAA